MIISFVVATSINNAIGKGNQLLWHLPADLKFFKSVTMGHPVVMGRKTFESIGRALPGRKNVVITRDPLYNQDKKHDLLVVASVEEALEKLKGEEQVDVIGGGEIYKQTMDIVNVIYRTLVHTVIDGDVYFPEIDENKFELVWEEKHFADEKNKFDYTFQKFVRK